MSQQESRVSTVCSQSHRWPLVLTLPCPSLRVPPLQVGPREKVLPLAVHYVMFSQQLTPAADSPTAEGWGHLTPMPSSEPNAG